MRLSGGALFPVLDGPSSAARSYGDSLALTRKRLGVTAFSRHKRCQETRANPNAVTSLSRCAVIPLVKRYPSRCAPAAVAGPTRSPVVPVLLLASSAGIVKRETFIPLFGPLRREARRVTVADTRANNTCLPVPAQGCPRKGARVMARASGSRARASGQNMASGTIPYFRATIFPIALFLPIDKLSAMLYFRVVVNRSPTTPPETASVQIV